MQGNDPEGPPPIDLDQDFDDFCATHSQALTLQIYAYLQDLHEAQDVVQEAFCRAFMRWAKVSRYDQPLAWVRRVAWNLATSRLRRRKTAFNFWRGQREEIQPGPTEDRVVLVAALAAIPPAHRRAVVLHHLADLTVAEIAEQEGVPEGTVKSWLTRGRAALAVRLRDSVQGSRHG